MLCITHANIMTPQRMLPDGAALIDGGRIAVVGPTTEVTCPPAAQVIDATGLLLAPGFIDLQLNGGFGHDFTAVPETIWEVAARLPQYGVTAFLPTIITSPPETIRAAQSVLRTAQPSGFRGAAPLGLHVEGPFLNPHKRGAHNPAYLRLPDVNLVTDWAPEFGVRLATLAPELPGAIELIRALAGRGVVVSAGHSLATYDEALCAFEAGVTYGTHLFNAMPPLEHRAPGLVGAFLTDTRSAFGLIVDGIHLHPAIVKLAWQSVGTERVTLVTDAMAALGMPPGRYRLNDLEVNVAGEAARLADGRLAGSTLSLDQAVRNLMAFTGCSIEAALATVTAAPARVLGLADERGEIAPGRVADLVLLAPDLRVEITMIGGQVVYGAARADS